MSRLLLAFRCFFAVLFALRLPPQALALLPPPPRDPEPEPPKPKVDAALSVPTPKPVEAVAPPLSEEDLNKVLARGSATCTTVVAPPLSEEDLNKEREGARHAGAIQMLSMLQRDGRLVDFLMENVGSYTDEQIGAAVRDIHRGCQKSLERFQIRAIRNEPDESPIRLEEGYDPRQIQLIGNLPGHGRPPFHGTLRHHGWRVQVLSLPTQSKNADPLVIAPAEVELGG